MIPQWAIVLVALGPVGSALLFAVLLLLHPTASLREVAEAIARWGRFGRHDDA